MYMHIEVFKTNVERAEEAERIITTIHKSFYGYRANFDLQDCDRILRVKSENGYIENEKLIALLNSLGYKAGVLPDN